MPTCRLLRFVPSLCLLPLIACDADASHAAARSAKRPSSEASSMRSAGIPFALAPGVEAAGYGLNTNSDGIQNYGELAVDCGGAGDRFCADTVPLEIDILQTASIYVGSYEVEWTHGTINDREFQMLRPVEVAGLTRTNYGTILEWPTRQANGHTVPPSGLFHQVTAGQERGAVAIAMTGVVGTHPYLFSAQEAVLAARYLREELGIERIVVSGSSYGGAASATEVALHPAYFDAAVSNGAPYDPRAFFAWSEYGALRNMGSSRPVVDRLYYPPIDSMTMAAAQAGLTVDNLDLTRIEDAVRPATFIMGEVDPVWHPGTRPEQDRARMDAEGVENVTLFVGAEEGHGGAQMHGALLDAFEPLYQLFDEATRGTTDPGARPPRARERDTTYDAVLRAAPTLAASRSVVELWSSVSQLEGGDAAHAVLAADGSFFAGSVQGFVTRRADDDAGSVEWSVPVGRAIQALALVDEALVVGSKRGLAVLDPDTGALLRETTGIGSIHDLVVADLIPEEPGLEVAARADMDMLHVESLSSGRVLSSTTVGTGGAMMVSKSTGAPTLLTPLQAGHVAAFTFVRSGGSWIPEAQWLSAYLAHDVRVVQEVSLRGRPVQLTGGTSYGEGRGPSLIIDDFSGRLAAINLQPHISDVKQIVPWRAGTVLVAGTHHLYGEAIVEVDLAAGSVELWHDQASSLAVLEHGQRAAVWCQGLLEEPSLSLVDGDGTVLWTEAGRNTSSAIDLYVDEEQGVYELSVMDRQWSIERFDLFTGAALGTTAWPVPIESIRAAGSLLRTDSGTDASSYQPFLSRGDLIDDHIRIATRCGRWVASTHILYEQGSLAHEDSPSSSRPCAIAEWGDSPSHAPDFPLMSDLLGDPLANHFGSDIELVDLRGELNAVMSSPGGQVARYAMSTALSATDAVEPDVVVDVAGAHTTLAASDELVVVGSMMAGADGATVHVLHPSTLALQASFDAGPVLAVTQADLDHDGHPDILTGTQNGWLRGYTTSGERLFEWSAGDFALGENGALFAWERDGETIVAAAVTGGWRVLAIE